VSSKGDAACDCGPEAAMLLRLESGESGSRESSLEDVGWISGRPWGGESEGLRWIWWEGRSSGVTTDHVVSLSRLARDVFGNAAEGMLDLELEAEKVACGVATGIFMVLDSVEVRGRTPMELSVERERS